MSSDGEPCVLGTKDFWDEQYETELENFIDHGDIGEIWFGKRVMDTIVSWVSSNIAKEAPVMDLGCGNGVLLVELARKGHTNLTGVDYSAQAVQLAETIATNKQVTIRYETLDVLNFDGSVCDPYKLILDKGTFDAISLMAGFGNDVRDKYVASVDSLLASDGSLVIATCNWTEEEITKHMSQSYVPVQVLPTTVLQFGGRQGNSVSVVVFRKK